MIHIKNQKNYTGHGFYVGRQMRFLKGSKLGNPYRFQPGDDRERLLEKYRLWLYKHIEAKDDIYDELMNIASYAKKGDIALICWCAPLRCHAEVIAEEIEKINTAGDQVTGELPI